ncbi:MAG: winged helix-turn-helix domain-containing protein [Planctomycetota bacterium]|nr:winged helix-turn-helix domain-containing protein [Planctomycetota bacterium]MDI6788170.1 winged helix-turn-helix domain-containing protein [Planctomycetota bacterium]
MYQHEIGKAAGEVWRYLDKYGPSPIDKTHKELKRLSNDLFHQAVGWLARENKIDINTAVKPVVLSKKQ